jgi:hypothetical protein
MYEKIFLSNIDNLIVYENNTNNALKISVKKHKRR